MLFQFFNISSARKEHRSAFNRQFSSNGKLSLALQVVGVHCSPAQRVLDTVDLSLGDWLIATAVASSTLLLEESRKLLWRLFR